MILRKLVDYLVGGRVYCSKFRVYNMQAVLTDTRCDMGSTLLVAAGAPVASEARDAVLAGALAAGLVAGLPGGPHRVAITS